MKIIKTMGALAIVLLLMNCGGSNEHIVGQKTTFSVNQTFDAGEVILGEKIDAEFVVKNTGDFPLVISDVKGGCTCTVVEKPNEPILPGDKFTIKASVKTENVSAGTLSKSVGITANTEPSLTTVIVKELVKNK